MNSNGSSARRQVCDISTVALLALLSTVTFINFSAANEESGITVTVDPRDPAENVPQDFSGVSFETALMLPSDSGVRYFRADNRPLLSVFHTLGIKSLRIGGNTGDRNARKVPTHDDIDSLFAFARAAGVKVIYTLRLYDADPQDDAATAKYIMERYGPQIECFSIGQEPSAYPVEVDTRPASERMGAAVEKYPYARFSADWKRFADAIIEAAPNARFSGPGVHLNPDWICRFMKDFEQSGRLKLLTVHLYPGGAGGKVTSPQAGRDRMLSDEFDRLYQKFYDGFAPTALSAQLPYRIEETNNFYNGGAVGASNTFASALWGLNFMWWWASHHAGGVNFHTGDNVAAGSAIVPSQYTAFCSSPGGYLIRPLGYGIKAFDLASHGRLIKTSISAPSASNISAYAVISPDNALLLTLINMEHGGSAREREVTLAGENFVNAEVSLLSASNGDVSAESGITLGGASIKDDGSWAGAFTPLAIDSAGPVKLKLPAGSAAILKLRLH